MDGNKTNSRMFGYSDAKFSGPSLASACSNVIKNLIENMNNNSMVTTDDENQNNSTNTRSAAPVNHQDLEEEEDNSDICSLPECDSDLLEVNPDAPHIHTAPKVLPGNLSDISLLQVNADDVDEDIIKTMNEGSLEDIINGVDSNKVGVILVNPEDITSDIAENPGLLHSVLNKFNSSYANERVTGKRSAEDAKMKLPSEDASRKTVEGNVSSISKEATTPTSATTSTLGKSDQPPAKKICISDVVPSTTPFLLMQKMLRGETDLHLSPDPKQWSTKEVGTFLKWLVEWLGVEEPLTPYDRFQIDGKLLFKIRKRNLQRLFAESAVDTLWMHVEALKFASVTALNNTASSDKAIDSSSTVARTLLTNQRHQQQQQITNVNNGVMNAGPANRAKASTDYSSPGSGQIQLWQFLLELLTEKNMSHIICWIGEEGAFKLVDPERVAQMWGERKNKPSMNYEKLSRALRYYYDGDLIHKVCGKRFVYQFVCDLKMLLGYSAAELSRLVNET